MILTAENVYLCQTNLNIVYVMKKTLIIVSFTYIIYKLLKVKKSKFTLNILLKKKPKLYLMLLVNGSNSREINN